jgi:hypothetical protein
MEIEKGCKTQQTKQGMIIIFFGYFGRNFWQDRNENSILGYFGRKGLARQR